MTNVSDNTIHLQGCYEIIGKTLVNTTEKDCSNLVIGTRKITTATKPTNYLLMKLGKKYTYVSSMYKSDIEYTYEIEYKGVKYTMALDGTNYVINQITN